MGLRAPSADFLTKETQCIQDIPIPSQLQALLLSIPWGIEANYFCAALTQVFSDRYRQRVKLPILALALRLCQDKEFPGSSIIIEVQVVEGHSYFLLNRALSFATSVKQLLN